MTDVVEIEKLVAGFVHDYVEEGAPAQEKEGKAEVGGVFA